LIDHDARSLELIARSFNGVAEGLIRDDVLDNVTLFWLTNTGVSAARLYWEYKLGFFTPKGVKIPVAVSSFPDDLYPMPRCWAELPRGQDDGGGHTPIGDERQAADRLLGCFDDIRPRWMFAFHAREHEGMQEAHGLARHPFRHDRIPSRRLAPSDTFRRSAGRSAALAAASGGVHDSYA